MRKSVLPMALLAALPASAFAADLPSHKALSVEQAAPLWTGFNVGLNAGATWANSTNTQFTGTPSYAHPSALGGFPNALSQAFVGTNNASTGSGLGFIGGGQFGYSHQVSPNFVVGGETDIQGIAGSNRRGTAFGAHAVDYINSANLLPATNLNTAIHSVQSNLNYLGTVRGKIGYLITPALQLYGTGGFAYGGVGLTTSSWANTSSPRLTPFSASNRTYTGTQVGWTAGGGVEWMFADNWSAKAEYLYYDLGKVQFSAGQTGRVWNGSSAAIGLSAGTIVSMTELRSSTNINGNIARLGVNYHMNYASAPVIAKF